MPARLSCASPHAVCVGSYDLVLASEEVVRGVDLPAISHVVIMHAPADAATFMHLAGRTSRMGRGGVVVVVAAPEEVSAQRAAAADGPRTARDLYCAQLGKVNRIGADSNVKWEPLELR